MQIEFFPLGPIGILVTIGAIYYRARLRWPLPLKLRGLFEIRKSLRYFKSDPQLIELYQQDFEQEAFFLKTRIRTEKCRRVALINFQSRYADELGWPGLADWYYQLDVGGDFIKFLPSSVKFVLCCVANVVAWLLFLVAAAATFEVTHLVEIHPQRWVEAIFPIWFFGMWFTILAMTPRPLVYLQIKKLLSNAMMIPTHSVLSDRKSTVDADVASPTAIAPKKKARKPKPLA